MKVQAVSNENKPLYAGFLPAELSYMLFLDEMVCLVIMDSDEKDAAPAGLCIYSVDDSHTFTIEWMFVDEPYRGMGYSQQFIDTVIEAGLSKGIDFIRAKLWCAGPVTDELEDPFIDRGFLPAVLEKKDRIFSFSSLKPTLLAKSRNDKTYDIKSFSRLPSDIAAAFNPTLSDTIGVRPDIDPDVSKAVIADGEVKAAIIVRRTGSIYYPALLVADPSLSPAPAGMLISHALYAMQNQAGSDGLLCLSCADYDPLSAIGGFFTEDNVLCSHGYELSSDFEIVDSSVARQRIQREKDYYDAVDSIPTKMVMTGVIYE